MLTVALALILNWRLSGSVTTRKKSPRLSCDQLVEAGNYGNASCKMPAT